MNKIRLIYNFLFSKKGFVYCGRLKITYPIRRRLAMQKNYVILEDYETAICRVFYDKKMDRVQYEIVAPFSSCQEENQLLNPMIYLQNLKGACALSVSDKRVFKVIKVFRVSKIISAIQGKWDKIQSLHNPNHRQ